MLTLITCVVLEPRLIYESTDIIRACLISGSAWKGEKNWKKWKKSQRVVKWDFVNATLIKRFLASTAYNRCFLL